MIQDKVGLFDDVEVFGPDGNDGSTSRRNNDGGNDGAMAAVAAVHDPSLAFAFAPTHIQFNKTLSLRNFTYWGTVNGLWKHTVRRRRCTRAFILSRSMYSFVDLPCTVSSTSMCHQMMQDSHARTLARSHARTRGEPACRRALTADNQTKCSATSLPGVQWSNNVVTLTLSIKYNLHDVHVLYTPPQAVTDPKLIWKPLLTGTCLFIFSAVWPHLKLCLVHLLWLLAAYRSKWGAKRGKWKATLHRHRKKLSWLQALGK